MKTTAKAALISTGLALSLGLGLPLSAEETTNLDEFNSIDISGGPEVTVYPSDTFRIVALNDDAEEDYEFYVRRGTLYIKCERRHCPRRSDAEYAVYASDLTHLEVAGGGSITLDGDFDDVGTMSIEIAGGGHIDLEDVSISDMDVDIAGGGKVDATVTDQLSVDIAGGGTVHYSGDPKIKMSVAGGGEVSRKD